MDSFDFLPGLNPLRPIRTIHSFGDDALVAPLAGSVEQRLPVAFVVLAVEDGLFEIVALDQLLQQLLTSDLGELPEVLAIKPQKIEGEVNQTVLVASTEVGLQFREVGAAFMDDDNLTIHDDLPFDVEGAGKYGEPIHPVMPVPGEGLSVITVDVELDAVATYLTL